MDDDSRGDYTIRSLLGRGGMGLVYLARHEPTGRAVALKSLTRLDAHALSRMRQEIRVLRHLRHPGVVRLLDEGVEKGVPWYAMELIRGHTLEDLLRTLHPARTPQSSPEQALTAPTAATAAHWTHQCSGLMPDLELSLEASSMSHLAPQGLAAKTLAQPENTGAVRHLALRCVAALCRTLAYVHGEGVVHGDLKPANILITEVGRVVLVDFGLATHFGGRVTPETLAFMGRVAGTASTITPEQILGHGLDARSDLYALGCVLYRCLTGRLPFEQGDVREIMSAHLHQPPPPLSGVDIDPSLVEVVMALLTKRPEDRPGHAGVVLRVLERLGIEPSGSIEAPEGRPYLFRPALSGRRDLFERLEDMLVAAAQATGRVVLVPGESGVGKTRLASEIIRHARQMKVRVLTGTCRALVSVHGEVSIGGPLHPFEAIVREVAAPLRGMSEEAVETALGPRGPVLSSAFPELSHLKGLERREAPRLGEKAARRRLLRALWDTIEAHTGGGPLLLVLDDLQWADELTLDALSDLTELALGVRPWLILGLYRAGEANERLKALQEAERAEAIHLSRLDETGVSAMIQGMMGTIEVSPEIVDFVVRQSEGNPFYACETLRTMAEHGLLTFDSAGRWFPSTSGLRERMSALPMPTSIKGLVHQRLETLGAEARRVCEAAALLGRQIDLGLLEAVCGMRSEALDDALDELSRRAILEEAAREGEVRFVHDKAREAALSLADLSVCVGLHRKAAETLAEARDRDEAVDLAALAFHWEGARVHDEALRAYLDAGEAALTRYSRGEAERLLRRGLALETSPSPERHRARFVLAHSVLIRTGREDEAREVLEGIISETREGAEVEICVRALRLLASLMDVTRQSTEAISLIDEALDLSRAQGLHLSEGQAHNEKGEIFRRLGDYDPAMGSYKTALAIFEVEGDQRSQGRVLNNMAIVHRVLGNPDEAMGLYAQALAIFKDAGDKLSEAQLTENIGVAHALQGRYPEASRMLERVLEVRREIGDRIGEARTLNNLGHVRQWQGHDAEALDLHSASKAIYSASGNQGEVARIMIVEAIVHRRRRCFDLSESLCDEALAILSEQGDKPNQADAMLQLGETLRDAGHLDRSAQWLERGLSLAQTLKERRLEATGGLFTARLMRASGDQSRASEALNRARALFETLKDKRGLVLCHCEAGRMAAARGERLDEHLDSAIALALELATTDQSEVEAEIAHLRQLRDTTPKP